MSGATGESPPVLSMVVVAFDNRSTIERCVAGPLSAGVEVIVVDNGSSDGTADVLREHDVRVLSRPDNPGFGVASNVGTAAARGRLVAYVNPDVYVAGDDLVRCAAELDRRPDVGVLGCRLVQESGELDHACKRRVVRPVVAMRYLLGRRRSENPYVAPDVDEHEEGFVDAVNGAFMVMRRDDARALGPFDPRYWMYMEDIDLCVRAQRDLGLRVLYWPGVTATHVKGHSTGRARSVRLNYHFFRSAVVFYRDHQAQADRWPVRLMVLAGVVGLGACRTVADAMRRAGTRLRARRASVRAR